MSPSRESFITSLLDHLALTISQHMREDIDLLIRLQKLDLLIASGQKDSARIPLEKEQATTRLQSSQAALTATQQRKKEKEVATKTLELDIETRRNTIARLKTQQFETKKNEEFTALGNEVVRYEADIDGLETQELELMEEVDGIDVEIKDCKAALDRIQAGIDQEIKALDDKLQEIQTQLTETTAQRKTQSAHIDEDLLELYDRLMKNKNGQALAQVTPEGQCLGCHIKLTPATHIAVQAQTELVQCENCARIAHL